MSNQELSPSNTAPSLRVGLTQWHASRDLAANLRIATQLIEQTAAEGADLVSLPENGLFLGSNAQMRAAAISLDSAPIEALRESARKAKACVVLGGFKNKSADGRIYNTALVVNNAGEISGRYDKIHLFDATIAGQSFEASSVEQRGNEPVLFSVGGVLVGLTICYDVRFPELYRQLALAGAEVLLVPAAFTQVTGQAHWEVLLRARAIENSAFLVASATVSGDGPQADAFQTWGHALAVDPWGEVMADLETAQAAARVVTLDMGRVRAIRAKLPVLRDVQPQAYEREPRLVFVN